MVEVAVVAGEEMAMVVLREEAVVMVPAHPQTQSLTHSLSHPSDVPRLNHRLMAVVVAWWASAVEMVVEVPWDDRSHDASSFGPPQSTPVPVGRRPRPPASCC